MVANIPDDIVEWAERYLRDSNGEPIKIALWQAELAKRLLDPKVKFIIMLPPRYGRYYGS